MFGTWLASEFGVAAQNSSPLALPTTSWNEVAPPMKPSAASYTPHYLTSAKLHKWMRPNG